MAAATDSPEGKRGKSKVVDLAAEAHRRAKKKKPPSGGPTDPPGMKLIRRRGEIVPCVANVYQVLKHHADWTGVLGFDEFAQRTIKLKPPPFEPGSTGEWTGEDDTNAAVWIAMQQLGHDGAFTPPSSIVTEAAEAVARSNKFHPVRDWLRSLPRWDGEPRIDEWLRFLGVTITEYTRCVARYFLIAMVARVEEPGVKFDYCLVLESPQGKGKSTALAILGGDWFGDTDLDLHNKDAMSALRGKWLYEFAELGSVTRAEASRQKSFLSRRFDDYRPVYGRREIRCPRQTCFSGSTNEWEWNKDPTGGRRFWPIDCAGEFDLDGLRAARDQLFAEAFAAYQAGNRFFPTKEEQQQLFDPEQLMREQQEGLVDALHDWVYERTTAFSIADAAISGLRMDASKLTRDMQTRIGIALRKLGCGKVERRNGTVRYWYLPPAAWCPDARKKPAMATTRFRSEVRVWRRLGRGWEGFSVVYTPLFLTS